MLHYVKVEVYNCNLFVFFIGCGRFCLIRFFFKCIYKKQMASGVTSNSVSGFSAMTFLGSTNFAGIFEGTESNRNILMNGNRNPFNMLNKVRSLLGNDVVFIIERNFNRNVVVYKIRRMTNGQIDTENPLEVFWLIVSETGNTETSSGSEFVESGDDSDNSEDDDSINILFSNYQTEELTQIEQTMAYGVTNTPVVLGEFRVSIRALNGQFIYIRENPNGLWSGSIFWEPVSLTAGVGLLPPMERLTLERIMACTVKRQWLWPTVVQLHVQTKAGQNRDLVLHFKI